MVKEYFERVCREILVVIRQITKTHTGIRVHGIGVLDTKVKVCITAYVLSVGTSLALCVCKTV